MLFSKIIVFNGINKFQFFTRYRYHEYITRSYEYITWSYEYITRSMSISPGPLSLYHPVLWVAISPGPMTVIWVYNPFPWVYQQVLWVYHPVLYKLVSLHGFLDNSVLMIKTISLWFWSWQNLLPWFWCTVYTRPDLNCWQGRRNRPGDTGFGLTTICWFFLCRFFFAHAQCGVDTCAQRAVLSKQAVAAKTFSFTSIVSWS